MDRRLVWFYAVTLLSVSPTWASTCAQQGSCGPPCWDPSNGCQCEDNSPNYVDYVDVFMYSDHVDVVGNDSGIAPPGTTPAVAATNYGVTMGALQLGYTAVDGEPIINPYANLSGILSGAYAQYAGSTTTRQPLFNYQVVHAGTVWGTAPNWVDIRQAIGNRYYDVINGRIPVGAQSGTVTDVEGQVRALTNYIEWDTQIQQQVGPPWSNCVGWTLIILTIAAFVLVVVTAGIALPGVVALYVTLFAAAAYFGIGMVTNDYQALASQSCSYGCYVLSNNYRFFFVFGTDGVPLDIVVPNIDVASRVNFDGNNLSAQHYVGPTQQPYSTASNPIPFARVVRGTVVNFGQPSLAPGDQPTKVYLLPPPDYNSLPSLPVYGIHSYN